MPTTKGSYWIYDWMRVDTNGTTTPLPFRDSVYIYGDTVINNLTYTIYKGTHKETQNIKHLMRDANGKVVNPKGNTIYSYTNFTDTIAKNTSDDLIHYFFKMKQPTSINIPAGQFDAVEKRAHYYDPNSPDKFCGDTHFTTGTWYVKGVGEVLSTSANLNAVMSCGAKSHRRLIDYHIAPE